MLSQPGEEDETKGLTKMRDDDDNGTTLRTGRETGERDKERRKEARAHILFTAERETAVTRSRDFVKENEKSARSQSIVRSVDHIMHLQSPTDAPCRVSFGLVGPPKKLLF